MDHASLPSFAVNCRLVDTRYHQFDFELIRRFLLLLTVSRRANTARPHCGERIKQEAQGLTARARQIGIAVADHTDRGFTNRLSSPRSWMPMVQRSGMPARCAVRALR